MKGFSVIMPTYNQCSFIRRAIQSLFSQTLTEWELIIVNDGCTDSTETFIKEYKDDKRITFLKNEKNEGLGISINKALDIARYDFISYLPSDDYYYPEHLENHYNKLINNADIILTYVGVTTNNINSSPEKISLNDNGILDQYDLQLVQVAHKKVKEYWLTRNEYVTENLFNCYWHKLCKYGKFTHINTITCFWNRHPYQRHQIINEKSGGISSYRYYYNVKSPLRFKSSHLKFVDEYNTYKNYIGAAKELYLEEKPLKILLVGDLSYNPERICTLEESGHKLFGLWTDKPEYFYGGPIPFGNIIDIPYDDWENQIREVNPDIIYALTNHPGVSIAYEVIRKIRDIPFVWHFKEGPSECLDAGLWDKLIYLYQHSDGKIYINDEARMWYEQFIPKSDHYIILDGDLPKNDYFTSNFSKKISEEQGGIHTVFPGRMIGLNLKDLMLLAKHNIHIHLYLQLSYYHTDETLRMIKKEIPNHFHNHSYIFANKWVEEFSRYDAGWLHCFESKNYGNILLADWSDFNLPARIGTLAAAGIPMIQKDNSGHINAMYSCVNKYGMGINFHSIKELISGLYDKKKMKEKRDNVLGNRLKFSFDYYADELITFFRRVIHQKINI